MKYIPLSILYSSVFFLHCFNIVTRRSARFQWAPVALLVTWLRIHTILLGKVWIIVLRTQYNVACNLLFFNPINKKNYISSKTFSSWSAIWFHDLPSFLFQVSDIGLPPKESKNKIKNPKKIQTFSKRAFFVAVLAHFRPFLVFSSNLGYF